MKEISPIHSSPITQNPFVPSPSRLLSFFPFFLPFFFFQLPVSPRVTHFARFVNHVMIHVKGTSSEEHLMDEL
ncbi:hypothetical protein BDV33DRAFT_165973 [Aspergillus novoparasiticus]|uniref:Uncharacterized protein n=1 Tax=Aspergillus novoparasiticus TaxID=986946 RepID=A0A5N6F4N1_9EURO|nr:hypothetical protein BDV33DRAFT_165973 [Aspergillus novoparasiticus]